VALRAGGDEALSSAERLLSQITTTPITPVILRQAGALRPLSLLSFDAIHLATAISLDSIVSGFVCYDVRLGAAATDRGLTVAAPS
jgi:predicted nucleic acid-binding protein